MSPSYAPGPNTCVQCLKAYRDAKNIADHVNALFSGEGQACTLQYPKLGQANFSSDGISCNTSVCSNQKVGCHPIPAQMRGDAFDLQDMIEFLVIEVEDNLPKRSKKSGVQRQLADFVADLVGEFVEVVEIVEQPQHLHHTSSQALSDHVHHRRMLAAAQYPFPNPKDVGDYEDQNKENILAWVKRSELRLLPGDHGFARWRTAKIVFRQSVRKFLKTEEIEEVGSSSAEVTEFLNNKFPLVVL